MKFQAKAIAAVTILASSLLAFGCTGTTTSYGTPSTQCELGTRFDGSCKTVGDLYDQAGIDPFETGCDNQGRCQPD